MINAGDDAQTLVAGGPTAHNGGGTRILNVGSHERVG